MVSDEKELEKVVKARVVVVVTERQDIHHPIPENNLNDIGHQVLNCLPKYTTMIHYLQCSRLRLNIFRNSFECN